MTNAITTINDIHREASAKLNEALNQPYWLSRIANHRTPVGRFVGTEDIPDAPAPAWYVPQTGDLYIHADDAGIDTDRIRVDGLRSDTLNSAKALGLLAHEAAHAAISEDLHLAEKRAPHHRALLTMIEEIRVENHALRRVPDVRSGLRGSFTIILANIRDLPVTDHAAIARAWALVQGRTLAGISTLAETKPMDEAARIILGDDTVDTLTDLLQEALTLSLPHDTNRLIEICDEWRELVGESEGDGHGEGDGCEREPDGTPVDGSGRGEGEKSEGGDGRGGSGSGDKSDDESGPGSGSDGDKSGGESDLREGEGDYNLGIRDSVKGEVAQNLDLEAQELADAALKQMAEAMEKTWNVPAPREQRADAMKTAHKVFGHKRTYKRLSKSEPTRAHRQAVIEVSDVLSNLALPAVSKVGRATELPPGRLRSREAVRQSAERSQGRMTTAKPWKGTVRRHATARPLVVGIATDTSGSMSWAERAVAELAYVYANAGHRIGARTAAVTFGDHVYPIARPGQVMTHVVGKDADDGTEEADEALAALDGVLHLTDPSYAARFLIVVSDGYLVKSGEENKVTQWLEEMTRAGTYVLWVGSPGSAYSTTWVEALAARLPNLTIIVPEGRDGESKFAMLNAAILKAIKEHIR